MQTHIDCFDLTRLACWVDSFMCGTVGQTGKTACETMAEKLFKIFPANWGSICQIFSNFCTLQTTFAPLCRRFNNFQQLRRIIHTFVRKSVTCDAPSLIAEKANGRKQKYLRDTKVKSSHIESMNHAPWAKQYFLIYFRASWRADVEIHSPATSK